MSWTVPFVGFIQQYANQKEQLLEVIDSVLSGGDLILRQQLEDFEAHLAEFTQSKRAVGVSNCTDAMHLALRAADIGAGDEVITVAHTFVATAAAVHHAGAIPVLVEVGDDHLMDVADLEAAITERTRAIMPVQLNGRVCDMTAVQKLADQHDLIIIEDAAQALGATYNGQPAGSFGLAGCFSFYPAKLLGALGDAGALVTDDEAFADRVTRLRNHGRMPDGDVSEWSFNCRMDNLQAALLDFRLSAFPDTIVRRREIASLYQQGLGELDGLLLPPPPLEEGPHYDVFQNYEIEAERRVELQAHLTAQGVETMLPWGGRGVHQFAALGLDGRPLPRTDRVFERSLLLPLFPELTDDDIEYVVNAVHAFYA